MRTVLVQFPQESHPFAKREDRAYSYFVPEGDEPEIGDFVLTSVTWDNGATLDGGNLTAVLRDAKMATVVEVELTPGVRANKFYVALVKTRALVTAHEANLRVVEENKRRKSIKARLDRMLSEGDQDARYRQLAAVNPEAAKLLAELTGQPFVIERKGRDPQTVVPQKREDYDKSEDPHADLGSYRG